MTAVEAAGPWSSIAKGDLSTVKFKSPIRLALDSALVVSYLVAMNTFATGIPVHEWLSVLVAGIVMVHLLTEWDWTIRVVTRFFRRLARLSRLQLAVDILLFVAFVLVMVSGFLVSQAILPLLGLRVPFGPTWRIVHALSADLALVIVGVHAGLHWRWFVAAFGRVVRRRPLPDAAG